MGDRPKIALAFVVLFVIPPVSLLPFREPLQALVPEPTLWQTGGMVLGGLLLFALGVRWWQLQELEGTRSEVSIDE